MSTSSLASTASFAASLGGPGSDASQGASATSLIASLAASEATQAATVVGELDLFEDVSSALEELLGDSLSDTGSRTPSAASQPSTGALSRASSSVSRFRIVESADEQDEPAISSRPSSGRISRASSSSRLAHAAYFANAFAEESRALRHASRSMPAVTSPTSSLGARVTAAVAAEQEDSRFIQGAVRQPLWQSRSLYFDRPAIISDPPAQDNDELVDVPELGPLRAGQTRQLAAFLNGAPNAAMDASALPEMSHLTPAQLWRVVSFLSGVGGSSSSSNGAYAPVAVQPPPSKRWRVDEATFRKLSVLSDDADDKECAICCNQLLACRQGSAPPRLSMKDAVAVVLPCASNGCKSFFHSACIRPWLELNPNCPLCRGDLIHLVSARSPEQETASHVQPTAPRFASFWPVPAAVNLSRPYAIVLATSPLASSPVSLASSPETLVASSVEGLRRSSSTATSWRLRRGGLPQSAAAAAVARASANASAAATSRATAGREHRARFSVVRVDLGQNAVLQRAASRSLLPHGSQYV